MIRRPCGTLPPTRLSLIKDSLECPDFELDAEHVERLDAATKISLGFPHELLNSSVMRGYATGANSIDSTTIERSLIDGKR